MKCYIGAPDHYIINMSEIIPSKGIKSVLIAFLQSKTNRVKPLKLNLPDIECDVIQIEPVIKVEDGDCHIECELTEKTKLKRLAMDRKHIQLWGWGYWFRQKDLHNFVMVLDFFNICPGPQNQNPNTTLPSCMENTLIKSYIMMYNQREEKKKVAQFRGNLPSFNDFALEDIGEESNKSASQMIEDTIILKENEEEKGLERIEQEVSRGLEYLVSEFNPSTKRIDIPVTQFEFPSLSLMKEGTLEEQVLEKNQLFPEEQMSEVKLISAGIGIGTTFNEITEKVIQEREIRKNAMKKQKNDLLDILKEENQTLNPDKTIKQKEFERYLLWKSLHEELNASKIIFDAEAKITPREMITLTIKAPKDPSTEQ